MVTDSSGRHVSDLEANDFTLLIDGKPKPVSRVSYIADEPRPAGGALGREDVHRTIVFVVDELHTSPENLLNLRPVMQRFVNEQLGPGDLVSVMAIREGLGIYERFTNDRRQIEAGLDRLLRRTGQSDVPINQAVEHKLAPTMNAFFMETYHALTVAALSRAVEGLRDMPGRKAIVLFSDGIEFPDILTPKIGVATDPTFGERMVNRTLKLVDQANRSGVVFYTFDARGLLPDSPAGLQEMPNLLARATGGMFTKNTNGLSDALGKAMEDMTGYYLLAYQPSAGEFEELNKHSGNHRIQVKLNRPGLNVRSRQSFSFLKNAPEAKPSARADYLGRILSSPFDAGGIGLQLYPLYSASPAAKAGGGGRSCELSSPSTGTISAFSRQGTGAAARCWTSS